MIAGIIHAEYKAGHKCHHDYYHRAFGIYTVVDMDSPCCRRRCARRIEECLKTVIYRMKSMQLAAFFEIRFYLIKKIT